MKVMFETATVTTRPPACGIADIFPAESISDMIQPPKMSPLGCCPPALPACAKRVPFRLARVALPFPGDASLHLQRLRVTPRLDIAVQHKIFNIFEINCYFGGAAHKKLISLG